MRGLLVNEEAGPGVWESYEVLVVLGWNTSNI